jgi:hypothetical protein
VLPSACAIDVRVGVDVPNRREVTDVPPSFRHALDLLFVVEDSEDVASVQSQLGGLWERVRGHLSYAEGGFPEVRLGVISTDVGVGIDGKIAGCTAIGDAGALVPGADGAAWIDVDPADPARADQAIGARLQLGSGACPFEQPLAAMQRALDPSNIANAGFLRDEAALGVVFVAGADDCSIGADGFFDDGAPAGDTFRCFRDAVHCVGDDVGDYEAGPQQGCVARPLNEHLVPLAASSEFLTGVKADADALAVGALLGNPGSVAIEDRGGALALSPACTGDASLYPAVRLGAFAGSDDVAGAVTDLCSTTVADAGTPTALDVRRALGHRCLEGAIADVRPDEPGLQVDCQVYAVSPSGERELSACANPNHVFDVEGPCWAIKPGPADCGDFPTQLAVQVNWGGSTPTTAPADTRTSVRCLVEDVEPPTIALPD